MMMIKHIYDFWGIGLYWSVIEFLREQDGYKFGSNSTSLDMVCSLVMCQDKIRFHNWFSDCLKFGLFKVENDLFFSESLIYRMSKWEVLKSNGSKGGRPEKPDTKPDIKPDDKPDTKPRAYPLDRYIERINNIYTLYPNKCPISNRSTGKSNMNKDKIKKIIKDDIELEKIIPKYIDECIKTKTYIKNFGTFLNNLPDYCDELTTTVRKDSNFGQFIPNTDFRDDRIR